MMNKEEKNLKVFGYGLAVIAAVFGAWGAVKHGVGGAQIVLFGCSLIFSAVTLLDFRSLASVYRRWMAVAHVIGSVVTTVILGIVFIVVFTPIGIFLKAAGKDHLMRRLDPAATTYWIKRNDAAFSQEQCRRQF